MIQRGLQSALVALSLGVAVLAPTACATDVVRVATFNVEGIDADTSSYDALVDVLQRIDADVVSFQEINAFVETLFVPQLADDAGYPFFAFADDSGTLSGGLRNGVLSRHPIASSTSYGSVALSGDPGANDIGRDILEVVLDVPDVDGPIAVYSLHFKAGSSGTDRFRRAVETIRLGQAVAAFVAANPDGHVIVAGDLNDDVVDGGPFDNTFNALPGGLPGSFDLGNDITFPVVYDMFDDIAAMSGLGLQITDPTLEDSTTEDVTFPASGRRLDYVFASGGELLADETYSSAFDDGIDLFPEGNYMYKAGGPLPASTSVVASDHLAVFADFLYESAAGTRFGEGTPGTHALVPRIGISGSTVAGADPFAMRVLNAPPNTEVFMVLGFDRLTPPVLADTIAPGFAPGALLYVDFFTIFQSATDGDGRGSFPFGVIPAGAVGQQVDAQWFVIDDGFFVPGQGTMTDAYEFIVQ